MDVYEYYLSTCKYFLLSDHANKNSWVDLYSYLPCLRQMLSCCVCGNIMLRPKGPGHGICLHHVCSACIGGKMRLRPVCSWCRTHQGFVDNPGLRLLILCFKRMCCLISSGPIGKQIREAASNGSQTNTLIRVLDEAVAFEDDYVISNKVMPTCVPTYGMAPEPKLVSFPRGSHGNVSGHRSRSDSALSQVSVSVSVHSNDSPPHLTIIQSGKTPDKCQASSSSGSLDDLDKMPALLAPCTYPGMMIPEKLSPPLAGPPRADVHEQQDQWIHSTPHSHYAEKLHRASDELPDSGEKLEQSDESLQESTEKVPSCTELTSSDSSFSATSLLGKNHLEKKLKQECAGQKNILKVTSGKEYKKKKALSKQPEMDFEPPCKRTRLSSNLTNIAGDASSQACRKVCFCAYLNPPSRLTCCGQRCPCFSSQLPCMNCMCRGCRNPCVREPLIMARNGSRSDNDVDLPMPVLSPEPRL